MRAWSLTLLLALMPLLLVLGVNSSIAGAPTSDRVAAHCTRYCYYHACPHATLRNSPAYFRMRLLYAATIKALSFGGKGWYLTANMILFVVVVPLLLLWLSHGAIGDGLRIRQLNSTPLRA